MPDKSQMKLYAAIAVFIILVVAVSYLTWRVNDLQTTRDQTPKVIEYKNTEKEEALAKELNLSQKAAQQLADKLAGIHAGSQAPDVTYYTEAPTVEAAATKTAEAIQQGDKTLPTEALAKTDRTVVTADTKKQKVDVYKVSLKDNHKLFIQYQHLDKDWQTLGYMAGRWMGGVSVKDFHRDPHAMVGYVLWAK